jgi:hypothetical protein
LAKVLSGVSVDDFRTRRRSHYGQFLDGQVWELQRGVDFNCEIADARAGLYMACAREHGRDFIVRTAVVSPSTRGSERLVVQLCRRPRPNENALGVMG